MFGHEAGEFYLNFMANKGESSVVFMRQWGLFSVYLVKKKHEAKRLFIVDCQNFG